MKVGAGWLVLLYMTYTKEGAGGARPRAHRLDLGQQHKKAAERREYCSSMVFCPAVVQNAYCRVSLLTKSVLGEGGQARSPRDRLMKHDVDKMGHNP
jgi:hypothetical protein